jgi:hypothetical protein
MSIFAGASGEARHSFLPALALRRPLARTAQRLELRARYAMAEIEIVTIGIYVGSRLPCRAQS